MSSVTFVGIESITKRFSSSDILYPWQRSKQGPEQPSQTHSECKVHLAAPQLPF